MPRRTERRKALLYGRISTSLEVNNLPLKAALLYTWLLPHVDDQGRMSANPRAIKATVVPMRRDISTRQITGLLREIEGQGLIQVYEVPGHNGPIIQVSNWWEYQSLRAPQPSQYPPPPGWKDQVKEGQSRDEFGKFASGGEPKPDFPKSVWKCLRAAPNHTANISQIALVYGASEEEVTRAMEALFDDERVIISNDPDGIPSFSPNERFQAV